MVPPPEGTTADSAAGLGRALASDPRHLGEIERLVVEK
jgi:hypothetical protein